MKRALLVFLALAVCLSAAGCGTLLDGKYESVTVSEDELPIKEGSTVIVSSYRSLRNAILELVDAHSGSEVLTFTGYNGDVAEDLPRVCAELKAENALCAYAVDYISYDLRLIVSYYEAHIYINYSRSAEELATLQNIVSVANAPDILRQTIEAGESSVTFSAVGSALTADAVQAVADACYYEAPLCYATAPRATLSVYPNTGVSRIYAVSFDYGGEIEERSAVLAGLKSAAGGLVTGISGSDTECAVAAAAALSESCTWTRDMLSEYSTAYAALIGGRANAEGMAMGYKALCDTLNIPCLVISGRMDKRVHYWNMVELDGCYYHVDVSQLAATGSAVLRIDSDMRSDYWWDIDQYPASADPVPPLLPPEDAPAEEEPPE